jgi:uncharacterized protein YcfJ
MKKTLPLFATLILSNTAIAYEGSAQVIRVQPKYINTYVKQCHIEQVSVSRNTQPGSVLDGTGAALKGDGDALAGAIIGGVIGNQFGSGDGKKAATVAGVIIGSNMANGTSKSQAGSTVEYVSREVCRNVPQQVQKGEIVTFSYQGRRFDVHFD